MNRRIIVEFHENGYAVKDGDYGATADSRIHVFTKWSEVVEYLSNVKTDEGGLSLVKLDIGDKE